MVQIQKDFSPHFVAQLPGQTPGDPGIAEVVHYPAKKAPAQGWELHQGGCEVGPCLSHLAIFRGFDPRDANGSHQSSCHQQR